MSEFAGKVALVTGGTRGIGRACAALLAREGAQVALCGRSKDTAEAAAAALEGDVRGFRADIADREAVDALVKDVAEAFGPVNILVNNAGITRDGLLMRMKDEDWEAVLNTNLAGAFYCCRAVARGMLKQRWGRIINISSVIGLRGQAGQANYSAAKAGLLGFTKALAQELAPRNITVNAVAPGFIDTDMTADLTEEQRAQAYARIPMGRPGTCDEVAASSDSSPAKPPPTPPAPLSPSTAASPCTERTMPGGDITGR